MKERDWSTLLWSLQRRNCILLLGPELAAEGKVTIITTTAPGETAEVVSRGFVPGAGVDEDPVTGAAHAVLVPYWAGRMGRADGAQWPYHPLPVADR